MHVGHLTTLTLLDEKAPAEVRRTKYISYVVLTDNPVSLIWLIDAGG
jgi:hypothetical protein